MQNIFYSYLKENIKKNYLQESLFNIINKDQTISRLFLQSCDSNLLLNLLNIIFKQIPVNNETLNIRWSIQSFCLFLNDHLDDDLSNEIAMHDFFKLNDQTMNDIKNYIDYKGDIDNRTAHNLSFFLQLLRDEYPGIFYSILPNLQSLIFKIGNDRLYKEIGSNFITFNITPPIEFLQKLSEIDEQELPSFFQFHNNFTHQEMTFSIQKKFSNLFYYPSKIKGIKSSKYFTLTNSSLCKNHHFIDTIFIIANNSFINHKNTDIIQKAAKPILDILPYIIIANQSFIYSDYNQYSKILADKKLFASDSLAANLINRFQNDFRLLNFLSSQTGDEFCSGDLLINSFPFFLANVLQNTENILNLSTLKFFSISDKSADEDFNFVRSYGVFILFFSLFQNQIPLSFQLNNTINQISKLLCAITNAGTQSMIIVDLFSCIFLQDEKGQFICHPFIAQIVIQLLAKFDITPYINGANALFEKKRASKADTSLTAWMNNETPFIYKSIEEKNWPLAEKLTMFLPYYRKLYKQAMQADHYCNNEDNELSSQIKPPIKLNVLLSKQTDVEKLKEVQKKSGINEFAKVIIEQRLKNVCDEASLCSSFPSINKWQPVLEFAVIFDTNFEDSLKNIKRYNNDRIITGISKSLDDFLFYLYNYYRCAILIDSSTFDSIEDLFTFNFCKAIEGAIIQDKIEWAIELTKYIKKDLFTFIFENISFFCVNDSFINNIQEKFPLEATALSISNHVEANLPLKTQKIADYCYFIENKQNENEESNQSELIESLFNDENDAEDIIFAVDHKELFNYMLNHFDNETITYSYFKIFDTISYVSSFEDKLRMKQIETLHKIHQISMKKKPAEIVSDIKGMNDDKNYFDLLIDYLFYCVPDTELTIPLCTLFSLSLSDKNEIDTILMKFPNRFHVFLSRFFHVEGILPHLIKYSPQRKLQFLKSISLLPREVFIDSNIFDADTIAESYIRYDSKILEMPKEVSLLFKDEHLYAILNGTINSFHSNRIFYHLFQFCQDKDKFIEFWADVVVNKLKTMTIDSNQKENEALNFFNSLNESSNSINHIKFKGFRSLLKLVESRPFLRYRIPYSFTQFGQPAFSNEMLSICNKTDNVDIMIEMSESFGIDLELFFLSRTRIQLIFGDFNSALTEIKIHELRINKYSNPRFYDSTFDFFIPLSKCAIVNYDCVRENTIDKIENENYKLIPLNVFQNITSIIKINENKNFIPPSRQSLEIMKFLISNHCDTAESMSLFVAFSQFEDAFCVLSTVNEVDEQINLFINNIYFPAMYNNVESNFNDFISDFDEDLEKTGFLWDEIIKYFTKNNMEYGLMKALQVENKLEDASIIGYGILKKCTSFSHEISLLGNIIFDLKTSLNFRKTSNELNINENQNQQEEETNQTTETKHKRFLMSMKKDKKASKISIIINKTKNYDDILRYFTLAELQLKVCQFFIEQNATFSNDYDIISSDEKATYVSAQLVLHHEYDIMKEIKETKKLSIMNILFKACDLLNNESFEAVKEFMKSATRDQAYMMLQAFSMSNDRQNILLLIFECFDRKEQCDLFLEYNFIAESFALALEFKNNEIIPLIGHKAAVLGDNDVVYQCNKLLNII